MSHMHIGAVVARERKARGLTQEELAGRLGVTKAAVSKWELGQSLPDTALLPAIASQFSITLDELFDWREQLADEEVDAAGREARRLLGEGVDGAIAYMDGLVREHRGCGALLVRLAAEVVSGSSRYVMAASQAAPDDEGALAGFQDAVKRLAEYADQLCTQAEDACDTPELVTQAIRLRATSAAMLGNHGQAIALLTPLYRASQPRVGTELASAQIAAGLKEDASRTLGECARASSLELTSVASIQLTRAVSVDEVRAYVDAIESLDSAFDLSHASAPTLPAMHIAAATMVRALGDDAYACELLACAAAEVVELEHGLVPSNPRGGRATPSSSAGGASARDALERMRESPSFQNYPANARQMILSRELWGELVETDAYRKAVAPLG